MYFWLNSLQMDRLFLLGILLPCVLGVELTFLLDAKDEMCFFEHIKAGEETVLEFQVIEGGNLDVDMTLKSPSGRVLYDDTQQSYDSHTWKTEEEGTYTWCFNNKFSTFTSKMIYFDFEVGDEPSRLPTPAGAGNQIAMTAMETSAVAIHESLKVVEDYQTHLRLREASGRSFAEDINTRVMMWSVAEFVCILAVMIGQVFTLRSFFSDKKNKKTPSST